MVNTMDVGSHLALLHLRTGGHFRGAVVVAAMAKRPMTMNSVIPPNPDLPLINS